MKTSALFVIISIPLLFSCGTKPSLEVSLPEKYEDETVEVIDYLDSTNLASSKILNGKANLSFDGEKSGFTAVTIDGRTRAFYIVEPGKALISDTLNSAVGTPLNDKFNILLNSLDSIEQLDDMVLYMDFVEKNYNENKNNPIGEYFGIEWLRYAEPEKVDSMLNEATPRLRNSQKAKYYQNFAKLRQQTSPGKPYVDFDGENENGKTVKLSDYIVPGQYTLIDFWASWCPYCIKELPDLKNFYEKWKDKGVQIVGVAVRDLPEDTQGAVGKHNITWPVIYNAQRKPYDIYGFSGIPHHILIGPDGNIISRGENVEQTDLYLQSVFENK